MMKTARLIFCGAALCVTSAVVAFALPARSFERAEMFATCTGRLEALAIHGRTASETISEDISRLADEFEFLLDAVMPHAMAEGVPEGYDKKWRAAGWGEVAHLLSEMTYSFDAGRADRAGQVLSRRIAVCLDAVLADNTPDWLDLLATPAVLSRTPGLDAEQEDLLP